MAVLGDLFSDLGALARIAAAVPAGVLPARRWAAFPGLPIGRLALLSGLVTVAVGGAIGVQGFFAYARAASDGLADIALKSTAATIPLLPLRFASMFSPFAFLIATPTGWLADYLVLSGLARALGALFDDPLGDPLLSGLDHLQARLRGRARASYRRRSRERQEGVEVPDRLFTGTWAGRPDVDFVVVASRRKAGWTKGTFVITSDKWYTLGEPFDLRLPHGLRTAYPLTEQKVCEVLRRGVTYELPPLQPSPPRR